MTWDCEFSYLTPRFLTTQGLSPSVTSTGGWKQSKYNVVNRESWPSLPPRRFGGFAEIHHIQLQVDKASLEHCFVNCNTDKHK